MRALAMCVLMMTGCLGVTSKREGSELRTRLDAIRLRLDAKEKQLGTKIAELQAMLDGATALLARNNQDLTAAVGELRSEIRRFKEDIGQVSTSVTELTKRHAALGVRIDRAGVRMAQIENGKPSGRSSPEELWELSSQAFEVQRYTEAISIFERLAESYPTHVRADDAVYFTGQSYTQRKDWNRAIAAYQQLLKKYPASPLADDGLYFAAVAATELKNCTEARTYLAILKSKYKQTNVAAAAAKLDTQLRKNAKKRAVCTS